MNANARRIAALAVTGWLLGPGAGWTADADPPPIASFFRNPDIGRAELSPSGRWVAMTTVSSSGRVLLAVAEVGREAASLKAVANFGNTDVRSFEWVNDERLVFNTIDNEQGLNDQRFGPGLYGIKRDGTELRELIRATGKAVSTTGTSIATRTLGWNHQLASTLDDGSDDVIVLEQRRAPGLYDVLWTTPKRLNVATGVTTPLSAGAPDSAQAWIFDRSGRPAVAVTAGKGQREMFWRKPGSEGWVSIGRFPATHLGLVPQAVDNDGNLYITYAEREGHEVIATFDFATGRPKGALVSARGFDLSPSFVFDKEDGKLLGVHYETDAAGVNWFDPELKRLQAMTDARFPGAVNVIQCRRCKSDGTMLVHSYSDRDPGKYYLYRVSTQTWGLIGKDREDIEPSRMAELDLQRIKARDGEDLPLWITTPLGKSDKPRPAVVLVHGGPWVRGVHWRWNGDAEFLASRGYVVLEPEFRGSTGYGFAHYQKGFRQWGGTMEADLVDAVRWAADKGLIDPARVCIAGASYGGYATLMGLVRDPDTFKCGVAWVAVTDPRLLFEYNVMSDASTEIRDYLYPELIGDPVKDAEMLRDAAPVEHAKDIHSPLLMAFGGKDRRVPLEHGQRMASAMRSQGFPLEYVVYEGEGHGFLKLSNRVDFWSRVERFLGQQLQ